MRSECRRCRLPQVVSEAHDRRCTWNTRNRIPLGRGTARAAINLDDLCACRVPYHLKSECEDVQRIAEAK